MLLFQVDHSHNQTIKFATLHDHSVYESCKWAHKKVLSVLWFYESRSYEWIDDK